jgi:ADP-ribose pyrophosphatase YjhB (NUDIX family)
VPPSAADERPATEERILGDSPPGPVVDLLTGAENPLVVRLREFFRDPSAPRAHDVLPAAFAAVRNATGQILLVRRVDDGYWELPGGRIEVGESAVQAVLREVLEESGVRIELTGLAGVYSDPTHVLVDPGDVVHQQLALCFHAVPARLEAADGPRPDGVETDAAAWFAVADLPRLIMHPAVRMRVGNAVAEPHRAHYE